MSMENHIAHVEEDPDTKELILVFPDGLLEGMGWQPGDTIKCSDNGDGSWSLTKVKADAPTL